MSAVVSACYTYPLKSGAAIGSNVLELTNKGPKYDRMWMLVDANGQFMSQREKGNEKLALVQPEILKGSDFGTSGEHIRFKAPAKNPLNINQIPQGNDVVEATVHGNACAGREVSKAASRWFSEYLDKECHLIAYADDRPRMVDPAYGQEGDKVGFADGMPLLVTSTSSLGALSHYFPDNVNISMNRFRPNVVIDGLNAFEEDVIHHLRIGDVELEFVKPCARCVLTTVNQDSGRKNKDNQPMGALVKARRGQGDGLKGVFFGQNAIPRALGSIHVGQQVEIVSRQKMHVALQGATLKFQS